MERIKFKIEVPKAVALAHGSGHYGDAVYEPTDEWLASLPSEARARLAELLIGDSGTRLYDYTNTYPIKLEAPIGDESVRNALYAALLAADVAKVERERKRAKESADKADRVAKFLALGYDDLFDVDGKCGGCDEVVDYGHTLHCTLDAREAQEHAKPFFERALARRAEVKAAAEAAIVAEKERRAKLAESIECDVRTWAAECPQLPDNLRRAAREGRNVRSAVETAVVAGLDACLRDHFSGSQPGGRPGWFVEDAFDEETRTDVPTAEAYALRDALLGLRDGGDIEEAVLLPGAEVEIGPIARLDIAPKGVLYRTGCAVRVTHPWLRDWNNPNDSDTFERYVLAEDPDRDD